MMSLTKIFCPGLVGSPETYWLHIDFRNPTLPDHFKFNFPFRNLLHDAQTEWFLP